MGLTEMPSELFRMKNVKELDLNSNNLCSLQSEVALMTTLEDLWVRLPKRLDRDLSRVSCFQVFNNQLKSLPPELGLLTNLRGLYVRHSRLMDHDLTLRSVLSVQGQPAHVAPCRNRPAATARGARSTKFELIGS
jgi:hypothetical protein